MRASDAAKFQYLDALAAEYGADAARDFKVELDVLERRYTRECEGRNRDQEAARLLPLGAGVVAERQGCHRATAYRRADRAKIVALLLHNATTAA